MKSSRHFLLASDFDQTLSFNDSGFELSELLGVRGFEHKVAGLVGERHLVVRAWVPGGCAKPTPEAGVEGVAGFVGKGGDAQRHVQEERAAGRDIRRR